MVDVRAYVTPQRQRKIWSRRHGVLERTLSLESGDLALNPDFATLLTV